LQFNSTSSSWIDPQTYLASYDIIDANVENASATLNTAGAEDINGNADQLDSGIAPLINIDTKNPAVALTLANTYNVISSNIGTDGFNVVIIYDEPMNTGVAPTLTFPAETSAALTFNAAGSGWISNTAYNASFNVAGPLTTVLDIDVAINGAEDALGNLQLTETIANFFDVNDVVSVEENNFSATSVMMYPNPAIVGQPITIAFKNLPSDLQVIVLSADGKQVDTNRSVNTSSNTITVDTNGLASGIYFVQLMSENGKLNLRFTLN